LSQKPFFLTDAEIETFIPKVDIKNALNKAFIALYNHEAAQPPQTLIMFPGGRGDLITKLGILSPMGVFGAKLSPCLTEVPQPVVTSWTVLMSMKTGEPLLLCDSARLTCERTAGTTALAIDLLAAPEASILAVFGTGRQALAHLRHAAILRPWQEVRIFSPNLAGNLSRLEDFKAAAPGTLVLASPTAEKAASLADVIILATSSVTPVLDLKTVKNGALVTSISTSGPKAHEIAPQDLAGADVYCDYASTAPSAAGEMVLACEEGLWSEESLKGDLPALCANILPRPAERPIYFRSVGLGIADVAVAFALYQAITDAPAGDVLATG
jgi:L-arginine dehydrogenase